MPLIICQKFGHTQIVYLDGKEYLQDNTIYFKERKENIDPILWRSI